MTYNYEIIRSNRRTLALEITENAELLIRAPRRCSSAYIQAFVEKKQVWVETHMEKQLLRAQARPQASEEECLDLMKRAKSELPPLVEHYAVLMGLTPKGIKITSAKKRFGSCNSKNSLCFSYRLMQYPQAAIEYVVVHELAHISHKNHGADFYALVKSVLPDYKARDKLLKK